MHENADPVRPHGHSDCAPMSSDAVCRYLSLVYSAQVGQSLGITEAAAGQRVARGLAKLRRILTRQGVAPSAAGLALLLATQTVQAVPPGLAASVTAAVSGAAAPSASAAGIAEGVRIMMAWTKVKVAATVCGAVLLIGGIAAVLAQQTGASVPVATSGPAGAASTQPTSAPGNRHNGAASDVVDARALLKLVADRADGNRERLVTWQAHATISEVVQVEKQAAPTSRTARVSFVFDRGKSACWVEEVFQGRTFIMRDGSRKKEEGEFVRRRMLKEDTLYTLQVVPHGGQRVDLSAPGDLSTGSWALLAPRSYFFQPGQQEIADFFMLYYKAKKVGVALALWREGDRVVAEFGTKPSYNRYTCDLSKGGNLVAFDAETTRMPGQVPLSGRVRIEYGEKEGVFYPVRWHRELVGESVGGGTITTVRDIRFEENKLNVPIDDRLFTLGGMGVRPGDLVADSRDNTHYQYRTEGGAIPEAGFITGRTSKPVTTRGATHVEDETASRPSPGWWLVVVSAVVVAAVVVAGVLIGAKKAGGKA